MNHLAPLAEELDDLAKHYSEKQSAMGGYDVDLEKALKTTKMMSSAMSPSGRISVLRNAKQFADFETDTLMRIAQDLIALRQETLNNTPALYLSVQQQLMKTGDKSSAGIVPANPAPSAKQLIEWAVSHDVEKDCALKTLALADRLSLPMSRLEFSQFRKLAGSRLENLRALFTSDHNPLGTEPIGYLHMERLAFTPAGIERGELVYSVPLSPGEQVNITHKEWSNTSEEFERIVTDYKEEYSEEGVAEKSELAQSTNSQTQHSTTLNTGVTASGSYGPVSITATAGYNVADSATKSEQLTRNHSSEITSKASSRSKTEHKISFKIASAAGTEDQTVRLIKNPFTDRATRVDYYQLLRKWRVDLYRYGLRLTWDVVIPEPGAGLISRLREINKLREELELGFAFSLVPEDISFDPTSETYFTKWAEQYQVTIGEQVPQLNKLILVVDSHYWGSEQCNGAEPVKVYVFETTIPEEYEVSSAGLLFNGARCPNRDSWGIKVWDITSNELLLDFTQDTPDINVLFSKTVSHQGWNGREGKLGVLVEIWRIREFSAVFDLCVTLSQDSLRKWQSRIWQIIRDAVETRYLEQRRKKQEKLARLEEDLGAQDALSLRKKEREEVMKGVLRWLLGDEFGSIMVDPEVEAEISEEETGGYFPDYLTRERILGHGKEIKFLHHAVEWENMLYFLYPYFWSNPSSWEFRKYLDHPDFTHRAFLRSGAARIVLTIRPGFEDAFLSFINGQGMDGIPPYPYLDIGDEFKAYANTNYPGIPPANLVENARPLLTLKQKRAWEEMQVIMMKLEEYAKDHHQVYPPSLAELGAGIRLNDPWGTPYAYNYPGDQGKYDLTCYGADMKPGGEDENADITSWAEASLIGTWFEYTPTSALDIEFDQQMPKA